MSERKNTDYLTLLNVISMIAVVTLHANGCFWTFSATASYWLTANVIECLFYFAVPIFFMISGATLLDFRDRYDTRSFIKKRVLKTVIPFLFWSVFGILYRLCFLRDLSLSELSVSKVISGILNAEYTQPYWFFLTMFVLYATYPLLSLVPKQAKARAFGVAALVMMATNVVIPFLLSIFHTGVSWPLTITGHLGYLMYPLLGYWLVNVEIPRRWRIVIYVLALLGLMAHCLGTAFYSLSAGVIVQDWKGYLNLPCVFYSIGIFVFFRYHGNRVMSGFLGKPVRALAPYSFTVYLLHIFLLYAILKVAGHFGLDLSYTLWYRLGAVFVVVPVSVLIAWVIRKIPVVKHILP